MAGENPTAVTLFSNYAREIENHWKDKEKQRREYCFTSPQLSHRIHLIDWLKEKCEKIKVSCRTVHLAVYLLDMFMDKHSIKVDRLGFVSLVCLMLAAKFEEPDPKIPRISELNKFDEFRYSSEDFIKVEAMVVKFLDFDLAQPTIAHFAEYYAMFILIPNDLKNIKYSLRHLGDLSYSITIECLDTCLKDVYFLRYRPSLVAAACMMVTRRRLGLTPSWTTVLADITGYAQEALLASANVLLRKLQVENSLCEGNQTSPDQGYMSDTP